MAASILLTLAWETEAANKPGGGGSTTTQPIAAQFWLDYLHPLDSLPNVLLADRDPDTSYPTLPATAAYKDGIDYVTAKVGRDQNINFNLASQYKKPAVRHFILNGGVNGGALVVQPVPLGCEPSGVGYTDKRPTLASTVIPKTMGVLYGLNFADTPPGWVRHVDASLTFQDDAGKSWTIYFGARPLYYNNQPDTPVYYAPCGSCVLVKRLGNVNGKSRWRFATEGQPIIDPATGQIVEYVHRGYLYTYSDTNPISLLLAGVVDLPLGGTIESLSQETEPSSAGYSVPDNPAGCPLGLDTPWP